MPLPDGVNEPVSVPEAKARLGIRTDARNEEIGRLISAAREHVEDLSGHLLVRRPFQIVGQTTPSGLTPIRVHVEPVHDVNSFAVVERDGSSTALEGTAFLGGMLYPPVDSVWPVSTYGFVLEVDAGYEEGECPAQLIQALLLLVGHWFENHEAVVVGTSGFELPLGVKDLCRNFRAPGFE